MRGIRFLFASCAAAMLTVTTVAGVSAAHPTQQGQVDYHQWTWPQAAFTGKGEGTRLGAGGLTIGRPIGTVSHTEPGLKTTRDYDYAQWTSPKYRSKVAATQLVASWNAHTPTGTWIEVRMRATTSGGATSGWYVMGRWAYQDTDIQRTSVNDQSDAIGDINTDTFEAASGVTLSDYQLQVTMYRASGTKASPSVSLLGAMTSAIPDRYTVPASKPGVASGVELKVPTYAQDLHTGQYPQYGGGGESWCSPTSTSMVAAYWGKHPSAGEMSWIDPGYVDPVVDYAARYTYDYAYDGTGNWPFNTAYAANYGLSAHVTRVSSLNDAEQYIRRGIPVITSVSFAASDLDGSNYNTSGHLMVIVGFTKTGDVIVNDPATHSDSTVRNVYKRHQFETVWLRTKRVDQNGKQASGSGGAAYIITPKGWPLPR